MLMQLLFLNLLPNDLEDHKSTYCWFFLRHQSSCLIDGPSIQLDPYTPTNDYQILYASYKPSQQIKPQLELFFLVYHIFRQL